MLLQETTETKHSRQLHVIPNRLISSREWSLKLKEITLHPDYGSFLNKILNNPERLGFLSIAFDCSGNSTKCKLNFIQCENVCSLHGGESLTFENEGIVLFPKNKVSEFLRVGIVLFEQKSKEQELTDLFSEIESKIDSSELIQEILMQAESNSKPKTGRLERMLERLLSEIESTLNSNQSKHVTTFNLEYTTKEEWSFKGEELIEQDRIRVSMVMNDE